MRRLSLLLALAVVCGSAAPALASEAPRASGEYSRTPAPRALAWRQPLHSATKAARLTYREIGLERLLKFQRAQADRRAKGVALIGMPRRAALEADRATLPPLRWTATGSGAAVARVEVRSRDALALRVGLDVAALDDRVEVRVAGSDAPMRVVAAFTGAQMKRLRGDDGLFWTPGTDGEAQLIELYRPAGVPAAGVRVQAPALSHLFASSRNGFKLLEKIGESGSCNVDTACRVAELGQAFVDAKNAVAHMQFVVGGSTYICTGTLLADTSPATQIPYFYSANHCFAEGDGAPVPARMQAVANTLNTFWRYEATACGSGVSQPQRQLAGGAVYLYSDERTDAMLLRLNDAAPAGAYFAAWNAGPLPASSDVLAIHHPRGDAKKVSSGRHVSSNADLHTVGWLQGTTEGGSSGSGLFTLGSGGYELRGGLYGGWASCANTGSLSNTSNRDEYSRFDVVFPRISAHLAAEPIPMNGSRPLIPPDVLTGGAAPTAAPAAPSRPAAAPVRARGEALRQRQR